MSVPRLNITCVEIFHDQHPQTVQQRPDFFFHWNFTPVTVVHYCIRCQYFILLPNVWVFFKIYFAILHNSVARNNIQQSIRLNKQKKRKKSVHAFALHWLVITTWVCVEMVMFNHKIVISIIFLSYSLHFLLALNTIHFIYKLHLQTDHQKW